MQLEDTKKVAAAIRRLEQFKLTQAFDPFRPDSRPNPKQSEILGDIGKFQYRYVVAGNQCKPAYSLVKMIDGSLRPISEIKIGDRVLAFSFVDKKEVETEVIATWINGIHPVFRYHTEDGRSTDSTPNHQMPTYTDSYIHKMQIKDCKSLLREGGGDVQVVAVEYVDVLPVYDLTISHPDHTYICDGFYTGNSGKSQMACREIAWVVEDTHPSWKRPEYWGHEPLLVIVIGQDKRNIENELWAKKLKPFLDANDWKEVRQGGVLQHAESRKTRNKILFLSHSDSSDHTRKHLQGYVAHYVWLDEMPGSMTILEELQRRVDARKGYFLATFTPKFRNDEIRRIVDSVREPIGKKYRMSKLDNPLYHDRIKDEIQKLEGYSETYKNTVLYGDWSVGDAAVYQFDYDLMTVPALPEAYSPGWRHVASLDPAAKTKFGYTLWAEDPRTAVWYLVQDNHISGIADPNALFAEVSRRNSGYNITRQVCDPHEGWFIGLANANGTTYQVPYDKNNRKTDLIKGLQHALSSGKIKIGRWCATFIDEIQSCQWSETTERIVNASSYHALDCSQYFVDCMPKHDPLLLVRPWEVELRQGNEIRKKQNSQKLRVQSRQPTAWRRGGRRIGN